MQRKLKEVESELRTQRLKLSDVLEKSRFASVQANEAETELDGMLEAIRIDAEDCILEDGRKPDAGLQKRVSNAEKKLGELKAQETVIDGALRRQQAKVDALEAEIDGRKMEAFRLELGSSANDIQALMTQLANKTAEIERIAMKHRRHGTELAAELFPFDAQNPYASFAYRATGTALFNQALRYFQQMEPGARKVA